MKKDTVKCEIVFRVFFICFVHVCLFYMKDDRQLIY